MKYVAMLASLWLGGCASVLSRDSETISFSSEPEGQAVVVDGVPYRTPAKVLLGRDKTHTARFPNGQTYSIQRTMNGWFLANVLFWPGFIVDVATGDVSNNLTPNDMEYRDGEVWAGSRKLEPQSGPLKSTLSCP